MVEYTMEDGKLICSFNGSLDSYACSEIEEEISARISNAQSPVVFSLQNVDYIASSFLRICQKAFVKVGAENFSIINVSPSIKKVFKITAFDKFMSIQ